MGYAEEETNFAPIIAKIKSSGADGMIHIGNQQPAILISKAIADAGLTIPRAGERGHRIHVVISNAGKTADGWYSTCDWSPMMTPRSARRSRRLTRSATAWTPKCSTR